MIKTADKKRAAVPPNQMCYEASAEPSLGIVFCRKDGLQRFGCYAFLSTVDFEGKGELIFSFTSWSATVRGENLHFLWNAVRGCLIQVRELDHSLGADVPWVREVSIANEDTDAGMFFDSPAFPKHHEAMPKK